MGKLGRARGKSRKKDLGGLLLGWGLAVAAASILLLIGIQGSRSLSGSQGKDRAYSDSREEVIYRAEAPDPSADRPARSEEAKADQVKRPPTPSLPAGRTTAVM